MDKKPLRFRWRERNNRDGAVYDASLGKWHIGQITRTERRGLGNPKYWSWSILLLRLPPGSATGEADSPRAAAEALEAEFTHLLPCTHGFEMRMEDEILLRAVLGIPNSPELEHSIALKRGEHLIPYNPYDENGWERWLAVERAAGRRFWVSPQDMKAWYGDRWVDPRIARKADTRDPGPKAPRQRARR